MKVGDRLSLAILGLCCGSTFIALALTSVAKRQGMTGPPAKPDFPWLKPGGGSGSGGDASFDERLKALDSGSAAPAGAGGSSTAAAGASGSASSSSGGGKAAA
jgi:hypothetical protein